jgi:hypothetical protein
LTVEEPTQQKPDIESLFDVGGGPVGRGLERFRLAENARLRAGRVAVVLAVATWLPLLILTAIDGVAWGTSVEVPFVKDFLPYGQFLLSVPILVLGEIPVARVLWLAVGGLRDSHVIGPDDTAELERAVELAVRRWRGWKVNVVLLVVTYAATVVSFWGAKEWLTGGWQVVDGAMTPAGWWYLLISLPAIRFLALGWLWRFLLWSWLLWRVARLELNPRPTHPDRAGGLAFLGGTQAAFGILFFALGVQLSCLVADAITYQDEALMGFRGEIVAYVVVAVVILLVPLAVFAPKLARAREEQLVFLSGTGHRGAGDLESRLRTGQSDELPANSVSALCDFGDLYHNARLMRPVPLELQHVIAMVLAAVLPFLPLVFLEIPAQEVLSTLARLLI